MQTITNPDRRDISERLAGFWMPHLIACEDLFTHLKYVDASLKEIRSEALRRELESFDTMLAKEVPKNWRFKEYRKRTIITLAGRITYLRRIYTEPSGICHAFLDEVLGIRARHKLAPDAFLWIAKMASDISFRKAARAFFERTGAKISHWLVMDVIHEEGALILEEAWQRAFNSSCIQTKGPLVSQDRLFIEYDGISIPLQKPTHGRRKPRWEYEDGRKSRHFELKCGVAYAGKDDKGRREGTVHAAFGEHARHFWPLLGGAIKAVYEADDVKQVYTSSDMAGWCKNNEVNALLACAEVASDIDAFHLNREIRRSFGRTKAASHFISLVRQRRTRRLMRDLGLVIRHATDKSRYLELQGYLLNNLSLIERGHGLSMGTMEGTNAHVYAARMKAWGGAWSKKGACAMAAVRARIASGLPLITPSLDNVLLSDAQQLRRLRFEESRLSDKWQLGESEGRGYMPPQGSIVLTTRMPPEMYGWLYCS